MSASPQAAIADSPAAGAARCAAVYTFKDDPYSSHAAILRLAGCGGGRRVLDVGAADGFLAGRLTERGWRVTAIEQDPDLTVLARRRCEEAITCDLNAGVPELNGRFNLIIYGDVLEHLLAPASVFATLNQSLAAEARVIVSVPNIAHAWIRLRLLCGRFDYSDRGILDRTHRYFFTWRSLQVFLKRAGIVVERMVPIPVPLPLVVPARYHGLWLDAVHRGSAWLSRGWPTVLGYQFVVVGRRWA